MPLLQGGGSGSTTPVKTRLTPTDPNRSLSKTSVYRVPTAVTYPKPVATGGYPTGAASNYPVAPGSKPTSPTSPTAPVAAPTPIDPATLDEETLLRMLAGIEAQYGVSREQLLAGEGEASSLYDFILANLGAAETQAQSGLQEQSISRGVLRSGIAAEEQARIEQVYAQQRAEAEAQKTTRLNQIALAIQQLEAQLSNDFTNTAVDFANTNLGTDEALAQALALVDAQIEEIKNKNKTGK